MFSVLTALALVICYASTLTGMVHQWLTDDDMGHGLVVPLVIAWILWRDRAQWQAQPTKPNLWGWIILALGAFVHLIGTLGGGLFASSVALLISSAGVVVALGGFGLLKSWTFPFLLALFMLPKLAVVYNQTTLPLQLFASRLAATMLTLTGFGVIRDGNILSVGGHQILVAEACNGIRFLLPLVFVSVLLGYLSQAKLWVRAALLLAVPPLAIFANAVRVALAGAMPAFAVGTLHNLSGLVIFALTLSVLGALLYTLRRLSGDAHA